MLRNMRYWPLLVCIMLLLGATGLVLWRDIGTVELALIGGGFQFLGLGVVVYTVGRARDSFEVDTWTRMLADSARKLLSGFARRFPWLPWSKDRYVCSSSTSATESLRGVSASSGVGTIDTPFISQVDRLESEVGKLRQQQAALEQRVRELGDNLEEGLHQQHTATDARHAEIEKRIEFVILGYERWHLAGAFLFLGGIVFQGWAALG